jgi:hypothetical protein
VDLAELIWLMLQAGAVHEICGMKSYAVIARFGR